MTIGIFTKTQGYTNIVTWTHHSERVYTIIWGDTEDEKLTFKLPLEDSLEFSLEYRPIAFVYEVYEVDNWSPLTKKKFKEFEEWLAGGDKYVDDLEAGVSIYVPPNEELFEHAVYGHYLPNISRKLHQQLELLQKARSYYVHTQDYGECNEKL